MSLSPSEQVLSAQHSNLTAYVSVACSTVIFYDHIITLADEMDYIWYSKYGFNGASYIFLANRIAAMVYGVGLLTQILHWDTRVECMTFILLLYAANIVLSLMATVFSALRVYAISGKIGLIAGTVFALGLGPVCINMYNIIESSSFFVIWTGNVLACAQASRYSVGTAQRRQYPMHAALICGLDVYLVYCVSGALAILSDLIVIAVTWYRTHSFGKRARHNRTPFIRIIFLDGTLYFVTMLILNIAETGVATLWFNDATVDDSYTAYFSIPLGPILISRFILNLRRSQSQTSAADVSATLQWGATSTSSQQTVYRTLEFVSGGISSDLRDSPEMSSGSPNDYSTQEAYATGSCLSHDSCLGISSQEHGAEVQ